MVENKPIHTLMEYINWTITVDTRWDVLCYLAYGTVIYTPDLIAANPDIPPYLHVPLGATILVPIIEAATISPIANQMPAWKT
jgi:hypothetical protein